MPSLALTLNAVFLIAHFALSTEAAAQNIYKCGDTNTYSQLPCTGGIVVDTADPRTAAQKTQADLATDRNARTADAMEKARLRQEAIDIAANTPIAPKARTGSVSSRNVTETHRPAKAKQHPNKKEPEYFAAQVPGEKATKKVPSKSTKTKNASKS